MQHPNLTRGAGGNVASFKRTFRTEKFVPVTELDETERLPFLLSAHPFCKSAFTMKRASSKRRTMLEGAARNSTSTILFIKVAKFSAGLGNFRPMALHRFLVLWFAAIPLHKHGLFS